jgi:hypothetical protein
MKIKLLACAIGLSAIAFQSCEYNDLPEPIPVIEGCPDPISFANDVNPIINNSCALSGCHNGDNGADKNWTVFSNFQTKRENVKDRITRPPGTPGHMPAAGSITQEEIQTIVCWVDQGGINN